MKCSLGISNFLEKISSLSHSIVFLYFFALITEERLSYLSLLFFGTLHSDAYIFPFLLCFLLLFISQLFVRPPQTSILLFCISFPWGWSWSLSPVQCHKPPSIVHQTLCLPDLVRSHFPCVVIRVSWTSVQFSSVAQSCPTLCDPIEDSPPGSAIPEILQAWTLAWVAISFSNAWMWKVKVKSLSRIRLLASPWTAAYQVHLSMGFSRQDYWSGLPLPSLKDLIDRVPDKLWTEVRDTVQDTGIKTIPKKKKCKKAKWMSEEALQIAVHREPDYPCAALSLGG